MLNNNYTHALPYLYVLFQNSSRKGKKYALGVIICLSELSKDDIRHFQSFLFSHFTLIDAHLERLKEAVEEACHYRGNVISQMLTKVIYLLCYATMSSTCSYMYNMS